MTAVSAIHEISIEDHPVNAGIGVTAQNYGKATVHVHVDTTGVADTLNLNTYVPGTVEEIEGLSYYGANSIAYSPGSATWSGSTITFGSHPAGEGTSAQIKLGAVVKLGR
jgi:hypothetical protein